MPDASRAAARSRHRRCAAPTSSGVSVRHCMAACAIGSKRSAAPSHSTSPRQHSALPTKAAGKRYMTNHGISSRQRWINASESPFARRARDVADLRIPVVAVLVDEPEAQPHRIGKIDPAHAPRQRRAVVDAVGGKGEGLPGKRLAAPAALPRGVAASRRRILGVELRGHETKRRGRQRGFERAARAVDEKDVVPLLDARRREPDLCRARTARPPPPRRATACAGARSIPATMTTVAMTRSP